jgi:predicted  nucleic acid-binding Zn-ribbon protein
MDPAGRLLELQEIDLELDHLTARQRTLEAGDDLAEARHVADAAEAQLGELRLRLSSMDRDSARLEHEIDSLRQRLTAEERRLYDGSIVNAKELGSLQHEIENLSRRISDREDELLALFEQREGVEALVTDAERAWEERRADADRMRTASQEESAKVGSEIEERRGARGAIVPELDPDLLELYEDLRRQKKGVGAAAVVDGVCQGCHEQLSAVELDRLKRSDVIKRCEHCRRIVVFA